MIWYDHFLAKGGAEQVSLMLGRYFNTEVHTAWADPYLFSSSIEKYQLKNHNFDFQSAAFPTWSLIQFYRTQQPASKSSFWLLSGVFAPLMMIKKPKDNFGIIYFHTFPSFINETFAELKKCHGSLKALVFRAVCKLYIFWLKKAIANTNKVLVNSHSVRQRFEQYLGVKTEVLHPPVNLQGLENKPSKGYYLSSARLETNKRVECILAAFKKRPKYRLLVAGGGALENELKAKYADCKNIHFLGWQSHAQMNELYNYCKALIYLPKNEYFGIAPVEAMAAGKPVIAVSEGGILETMSDPRCGYLLEPSFTIDDVCNAIDAVSVNEEDSKFRQQHACQFDAAVFYQSLNKIISGSER